VLHNPTAGIRKTASATLISRILRTLAQSLHVEAYKEALPARHQRRETHQNHNGGKEKDPPPPEQVDAIKIMVASKKSNGAIATSLGLKKSTVAYVAAIDRRPVGPAPKDNRGRPKSLSERELRGLRRLVQDAPLASVAEIAYTITAERTSAAAGPSLRPVSVYTVRRAVKGLRLSFCAPAKKTFVSPANMMRLLQWGKDHESWTYHWAFVFFSDESSFLVWQPQARRVWRKSGQRYTSENLRPTLKSGRESVIVWGGFSSMGRTPLMRIEGSINASSYSELLENEVVHYLCVDFGAPDGLGSKRTWPRATPPGRGRWSS